MTLHAVPKPTKRPPKEKKRVTRKPIRQGPPKVRDESYLAWIRSQPCTLTWVAGTVGNFCMAAGERRKVEPAHVKTKGSGGADRGNTVPLCPLHHDEQEGDTEGFEAVYGVSLKLEAAQLLVAYILAGEP